MTCWIIFDIYIQIHVNPHSLSHVHLVSQCQGCIIQHMSAQAVLFQTDAKTSYCPSVQFCVCVCPYVWFYTVVKWSGLFKAPLPILWHCQSLHPSASKQEQSSLPSFSTLSQTNAKLPLSAQISTSSSCHPDFLGFHRSRHCLHTTFGN